MGIDGAGKADSGASGSVQFLSAGMYFHTEASSIEVNYRKNLIYVKANITFFSHR